MTDTQTPTPVADALTEVNRAQADGGFAPDGTTRPHLVKALHALADAVRSHGIGAELGQLRERRTTAPPVPGVTRVDGHTVIAVLPGVRDLAWYVAAEAGEGMWSAGHMFVEAGRLAYEPSGLYGSKRRALQVLAELAGIAQVAPF